MKELERRFQVEKQDNPVNRKKVESQKKFHENRAQEKELRKLRSRASWLEKEILKLEDKMKKLEEKLSAPRDGDDVIELTRSYLEDKRILDAYTQEWSSLVEKIG